MPQPPDRGRRHRDDLVGLPVDDAPGDGVAARSRRSNTSGASSASRSSLDPSEVDRLHHLPRPCGARSAPGTSARRAVFGPRPSSDADRVPRAPGSPSSSPPPQSPEIGPIAGNRAMRPSGATPRAVRAGAADDADTPGRSVPARSTANVSLRSDALVGPAVRAQPPAGSAGRRPAGRRRRGRTRRRSATGDGVRIESARRRSAARRPRRDAGADVLRRHRVAVELARRDPRGAQHRAVAAQQRRVDLRAAAVDREERRPSHGSSSSSSTVTNVAPGVAQPVDDRSRRASAGAAGPGVQQHHGAVAVLVRRRATRVVGDRLAGAPRLPVLELDVPVRRCGSRARRASREHARIVVRPHRTGSGTTAAGRRPSRSTIASRAVAHVGRGARRRAAAASARGSASGGRPGAPRRRSARAVAGYASAHRPCTKNVARTPAVAQRVEDAFGVAGRTPRPIGMLRVERQRDPEPGLTHGSSPSPRGRRRRVAAGADRRAARRAAGRGRSPPRARAGALERPDVDPHRAPIRRRRRSVTSRTAPSPSRAVRRPAPGRASRVSGSVAITIAARPGPGELQRAVAELRRSGATRPACPTASFNVSAPISAAARGAASAEDHRRRAAAVPRHEPLGERRASPSRPSIAAAASSASVASRSSASPGAVRRAIRRERAEHHERGGEGHRATGRSPRRRRCRARDRPARRACSRCRS